jgi:hypothetical protein
VEEIKNMNFTRLTNVSKNCTKNKCDKYIFNLFQHSGAIPQYGMRLFGAQGIFII